MKKIINKILCIAIIMLIFLGIVNNCMASSVEIAPMKDTVTSMVITGVLTVVIIGITALIIYLIPTFIACKRKHTNKVAIILINILLGWTFIGWVGCLIWACIDNKSNKASEDKYGDLARLQKLKAEGTITDVEFEIEKQKLLR